MIYVNAIVSKTYDAYITLNVDLMFKHCNLIILKVFSCILETTFTC